MSEAYASLFTGDELDYAVANALGNKYRGNLSPGCHLIGQSVDTCVDLDDLLMDGKYTIYHYINGPAAFLTEEDGTSYEEYDPDTPTDDDAPYDRLINQAAYTVRPIYLQIYHTGGDHLYQTIMVGAKLYWRDMYSAENIIQYDDGNGNVYSHIPWRSVDLGIEASVIKSSFEYDPVGNNIALSQRMGTAVIDYIRRLAIGNANLLDFTNGFFMYSRRTFDQSSSASDINDEMSKYWVMNNSAIETIPYDDIDTTLNVGGTNLQTGLMPLFDDIDDEIISLFRADAGGSFSNYYTSNGGNEIINKIAVSANTAYTASVYLIYDPTFISSDDSAFITISNNGTAVKTNTIKLNCLASAQEYADASMDVPIGAVYKNDIYDGTEYTSVGPSDDSEFKHYIVAPSQNGFYRLTVTLDSNDISPDSEREISISFGVTGNTTGAIFVLPKVEYGVYATQYNHSWGDLYYYFTNCESFFGVPIDINHPKDFKFQDGFIYGGYKCNECGYEGNSEDFPVLVTPTGTTPECPKCHSTDVRTDAHFNVEPIAVGGGGGFVQHTEDDLSIAYANYLASNDLNSKDVVYTDDYIGNIRGTNSIKFLPISYKPDGETVITEQEQNVYDKATLEEKYTRYKFVLFFNKQTGELLCWDDLCKDSGNNATGGLVSINKPFVIRSAADDDNSNYGPKPFDYDTERSYVESYVGKNRFWIDNTDATSVDPAGILKYWDPEVQSWLTPKTAPTGIYKVQPTAPGDDWAGKFWINSTTGVMYYYDPDAAPADRWKPLYAAWGSNPSSN